MGDVFSYLMVSWIEGFMTRHNVISFIFCWLRVYQIPKQLYKGNYSSDIPFFPRYQIKQIGHD